MRAIPIVITVVLTIIALFQASQMESFLLQLTSSETACATPHPNLTQEAEDNNTTFSGPSLCGTLSSSSTPHQLWIDHLPWILEQSRHPLDRKNVLLEQTKEFLYRISPRLPLFPTNLPKDWELVGRVANKVWKRYQYLQNEKNGLNVNVNSTGEEAPPVVKILVVGGSVTRGVNCWTGPAHIEQCNWVYRLGHFLNKMAGGPLADVANFAIGASNTQIGTALLRFELLPEEMRRPDIIINAYSTNDMHFKTSAEAVTSNTSLRDHIFAIHQEFVRTATTVAAHQHPCQDPPLLIFLDDYLGNEQREILATTDVSQSLQIIATYYGVGTVSYANMIRDIVYKNTREEDFSPAGWYKNDMPVMTREIHPQFGMHYTIGWSMAYYFLLLASTYCSTASAVERQQQAFLSTSSTSSPLYPNDRFHADDLPPILTPSYSLADISQDWKIASEENQSKRNTILGDTKTTDSLVPSALCSDDQRNYNNKSLPRCTFTWMSMLAPTTVSQEELGKEWIENNFATYFVTTKEQQLSTWQIDEGGGKLGWSPIEKGVTDGAPFSLEFFVNNTAISTVTILYMRSYGEKWENSTIEVKLWLASGGNKDKPNHDKNSMPLLHSERIQGFHNQKTSEIYPKDLELLVPIQPPSTLRIDFRLVAGTTFKILGLALCQE